MKTGCMGIAVVRILVRNKLQEQLQQKKTKPRKMWVKNWISRQNLYGASSSLMKHLKDEDLVACRHVLRISNEQFNIV